MAMLGLLATAVPAIAAPAIAGSAQYMVIRLTPRVSLTATNLALPNTSRAFAKSFECQ